MDILLSKNYMGPSGVAEYDSRWLSKQQSVLFHGDILLNGNVAVDSLIVLGTVFVKGNLEANNVHATTLIVEKNLVAAKVSCCNRFAVRGNCCVEEVISEDGYVRGDMTIKKALTAFATVSFLKVDGRLTGTLATLHLSAKALNARVYPLYYDGSCSVRGNNNRGVLSSVGARGEIHRIKGKECAVSLLGSADFEINI